MLEHFISGYNIYLDFFLKEKHISLKSKLFVLHFFSIFSLINRALLIGCYSNTGCRGPKISDYFEFCQSPWCWEESFIEYKNKVSVLAILGIHHSRTHVAQNRCSKHEWHYMSAKIRFLFAFRHFLRHENILKCILFQMARKGAQLLQQKQDKYWNR